MKKITTILFITVFFISCNKLDNKLQGGWLIQKVYYNNKPAILEVFTNSFDLNKNHSCFLPISEIDQRHTDAEKGSWKAFTKGNASYLIIKSTNKIFNKTFKIINFRKELDYKQSGYLLMMTLMADSIKMDCAKVPY